MAGAAPEEKSRSSDASGSEPEGLALASLVPRLSSASIRCLINNSPCTGSAEQIFALVLELGQFSRHRGGPLPVFRALARTLE